MSKSPRGEAFGIYATTYILAPNSSIAIENRGDISVEAGFGATGILAVTGGASSPIAIYNKGDITVVATSPYGLSNGINARSFSLGSNVATINKGAIDAGTYAIAAFGLYSDVAVNNSGPLTAGVDGIYASGRYGNIAIVNDGPIEAGYHGIHAGDCQGPLCFVGDVAITNTGSVKAGQIGILALTFASDGSSPYGGNAGDGGNIAVVNQGTVEGGFAGIVATAAGNNSAVTIVNAGTVKGGATGIYAATGIETFIPCGCYYGPPIFIPSGYGNNSPLTIINSGIIDPDIGISALTLGANSPIEIKNSGKIEATFTGIAAATYGAGSGINIVNSGSLLPRTSPLRCGQEGPATGSTATTLRASRPMAAITSTTSTATSRRSTSSRASTSAREDLLSDNDILVFGALGGFIHSDLDYDAINRIFSFDGGQVGGYATYLRGGLFVDTLVNVHLMQLDTRTLGFPNPLNATTVGVRTDSGYRFGSFHGGAFIEPLATISVDWADIDGFSQGGNKVSFNNDANVQGRLGLRVGTTTQLGYGITAEPFVIGSLWGNLSNDNQATLVSTGTTFILEDHLQDVWGEVSGGVNFFNPTASTSVFAKVDVTFGQDIDGVGGKAGMRVSW